MRRARMHVQLLPIVATCLAVLPGSAHAVDGMRVRTPVVWSDVPCMTIVDRSVDPVVHIPYGIPFEDTGLTKDEVADGRTHQFFALCTDHDPTNELPGWISVADVLAAEALGLIDPGTVSGDSVLDTHPTWSSCALRIVADDERRPITFAMADAGIDWDTSGVATGAWMVEGFTHDPAFSLWWPRPGVIKVVDDPDPAATPPAAAVLNGEEVVPVTDTVSIEGCVSVMPGATLDAAWAPVGGDEWFPFVQSEPVDGATFAVELLLPLEMAGQSARVRVDVVDPMGRSYTAYMPELVIALPVPPDPGCDDDGGCETTGGEGEDGTSGTMGGGEPTASGSPGDPSGDGTATSGMSGPGMNDTGTQPGSASCACGHERGPGGAWLLGLLLAGLLRPRRRTNCAAVMPSQMR